MSDELPPETWSIHECSHTGRLSLQSSRSGYILTIPEAHTWNNPEAMARWKLIATAPEIAAENARLKTVLAEAMVLAKQVGDSALCLCFADDSLPNGWCLGCRAKAIVLKYSEPK